MSCTASRRVAATAAAQLRDTAIGNRDDVAGHLARLDGDVDRSVERVDSGGDAEHGIGQRDLERAEDVVAVAAEDIVVLDVHLEVQGSGGAAGLADFALAGHLDAESGVDTGRDVDGDDLLGADAAVTVKQWLLPGLVYGHRRIAPTTATA